HEAAQLAVRVAENDDRDVSCEGGEVLAAIADELRPARVLPRLREDPLPLERVDLRIRVPARGKRQALVQGRCNRLETLDHRGILRFGGDRRHGPLAEEGARNGRILAVDLPREPVSVEDGVGDELRRDAVTDAVETLDSL